MKKLFFLISVLSIVALWGFSKKAPARIDERIDPNEIYVFVQKGCPHCWAAEEYLKETYPNLLVQYRDISDVRNRQLFFACGAKFRLNKVTMGTPLICMGQHYVLGWNMAEQAKFDAYVKEFLSD